MTIDSIVAGNQLPSASGTNGKSILGKDDFLNLMMIQMRNQDPLSPMDNEAMLSQMAQFTSLEQSSNLNDEIASLNANLTQANTMNQFIDSTRLLGKNVEIIDPESSADNIRTITAKVTSIASTTSGPILTLDNGYNISMDQVLRVTEPQG